MNDFPRFDLVGKTALVTGAARGLGRAISLALAHAGADVALGLRKLDTGAELVAEIQAMGRKALALQMDVLKTDEIFSAVANAFQRRVRQTLACDTSQRFVCRSSDRG